MFLNTHMHTKIASGRELIRDTDRDKSANLKISWKRQIERVLLNSHSSQIKKKKPTHITEYT